jgi:imidazolonepropionase
VEIKSGYGLTAESEIKSLRVIQALQKKNPKLSIEATFLGAHAFPTEVRREDYLKLLVAKLLPEVAKKKLASACDVFVDEGYFTVEEARELLGTANKLGLAMKIHADELGTTDATVLACELGALSADHLLKISDRGIDALAKSNTVGVLLPGTAYYLKTNQAPAREILSRGGRVALSTDMNPGTCMTASLPFIMNLAALYLGMTRAEIFAAVTYNAARALGRHEAWGTLEAGRTGYVGVMPFERFEDAYYRVAWAPRLRDFGRT